MRDIRIIVMSTWVSVLCAQGIPPTYFFDPGQVPGYQAYSDSVAAYHQFQSIIHPLKTSWDIATHLISSETIITCAALVPFYAGFTMADADVHDLFYCAEHHANTDYTPDWMHWCSERAPILPYACAGIVAMVHPDDATQSAMRTFLLGFPVLLAGYKWAKTFTFDGALRPWNQRFSSEQRSYGGFPSGHMCEMGYITTFCALRFGSYLGVPLAVYTALIAGEFILDNRHYLSQLLAGLGWGIITGKAVNSYLGSQESHQKPYEYSMNYGSRGFGVSIRF